VNEKLQKDLDVFIEREPLKLKKMLDLKDKYESLKREVDERNEPDQ
jgi:hypothetical protein